jgi:purine-nucleoside/S-methyl-5'-thioadenosine phosphorylase / adenosine deaminase
MPPGNAEPARAYPLRVPSWDTIPDLVHGFLGRGRSLGAGAFTLGDLRRILQAAGDPPTTVLAARQVHGARVLAPEDVEPAEPAPDEHRTASFSDDLPAGDALVSASADVLLTVRTADCVPILLVAPRARAVAAVHAGWRGLLAGVVRSTLTALSERYGAPAAEVRAAIGPAIGGCCYEFGAEHRASFTAALGAESERAWRQRRGTRPHLDLRLLCRVALAAAGVSAEAISIVGPCTAEHPEELHSYRRDGPAAGRQVSYIGWQSRPGL